MITKLCPIPKIPGLLSPKKPSTAFPQLPRFFVSFASSASCALSRSPFFCGGMATPTIQRVVGLPLLGTDTVPLGFPLLRLLLNCWFSFLCSRLRHLGGERISALFCLCLVLYFAATVIIK